MDRSDSCFRGMGFLRAWLAVGAGLAMAGCGAPESRSCALPAPGQYAPIYASCIKVVDGNQFMYGSERVVLLGADAPELANEHVSAGQEPHASAARSFLESTLAGAQSLEMLRLPSGTDKWYRELAYVRADGNNVSAHMVQNGHAYETISYYGYQGLQVEGDEVIAAAKNARPAFEKPWEWRRRHKLRPQAGQAVPEQAPRQANGAAR